MTWLLDSFLADRNMDKKVSILLEYLSADKKSLAAGDTTSCQGSLYNIDLSHSLLNSYSYFAS